jgi:hypothetical protein
MRGNDDPMLLMARKDGIAEPTLRCNACDRPIVSGREACIVYPGHMPEGSLHKVMLVHNECVGDVERQYAGDPVPPGTMSLITYLARFVGAEPGEHVPVTRRPRAYVAAPRPNDVPR